MAAPKRKIGAEILEGLRQLKRGEHGRITTVPSVATVREGTGLSQPRFRRAARGLGPHAAGVGAGPASTVGRRSNALAHLG